MFCKSFIPIIVLIELSILVSSRRECEIRQIPDSDTVCVCNSTYCDDIPALVKPLAEGSVWVYESNKLGERFKQNQLKFEPHFLPEDSTRSKDNEITITVNKHKVFQKILGFGGGFTDSTGAMLKAMDEGLATALIESYFGANGIEYSFGRVPVAATDYSLRPYTYDDVDGDKELTHFSLQKEDFDWKIPFIKMARMMSPHNLKLIGTNWSPPAWMKQEETLVSFSELKGEVGGEYYQILANYLVKFLKAYEQNGIEFWGLTSENEPAEAHGNPCLKMTPESLKVFVKQNLGPALEGAGFNKDKLKLLLMDEGLPFIKNWTDVILAESDMDKYVSGIALHWYYNEIIGHDKMVDLYSYLHDKYPNYFVINTEACILDGPGHGNWSYAERYAYDIIMQLNHFAVGWVEWNMVMDMNAGPTWFERHGCGGPIYVDPAKGEAYKQPSFYALGHFSKFVSPDSERIANELSGDKEDVSVLSFKRRDGATGLVVLNRGDEEKTVNIRAQNKSLTNKIGAHSIQSYIWWY